jgi:hypothetical protein
MVKSKCLPERLRDGHKKLIIKGGNECAQAVVAECLNAVEIATNVACVKN